MGFRRGVAGLGASKPFRASYPAEPRSSDGQTAARAVMETGECDAELVLRGADDGNRTRVFSLGSRSATFTAVRGGLLESAAGLTKRDVNCSDVSANNYGCLRMFIAFDRTVFPDL